MAEVKSKPGKRLPYRRALILLAIALSVLAGNAIFGEGGLRVLLEARRENQGLEQEIERLEEENRQLEGEIQGLRSDPAAIEKLAREQMQMAKPGEIIFTLPDDQGQENRSLPPIREEADADPAKP